MSKIDVSKTEDMVHILYGEIVKISHQRMKHELHPVFTIKTKSGRTYDLVSESILIPKDMEVGKKRSFVVEKATKVVVEYLPVLEPKTMDTSSIDVSFQDETGSSVEKSIKEKNVFVKKQKKVDYWKVTNLDLDIRTI